VRTYTSSDPPEISDAELAKQLIPSYWVPPHQTLGTAAGHHRWVWDLRGERPLAPTYAFPISAVPHATPRAPQGPRAVPGSYTVKLTAGGKALTAALEVKLDPRVKMAPAAVARLGQLETRLAGLVHRSAQLALQAKSVSTQLTKLSPPPDPLKAQISDLAAKVAAIAADPPGARGGEAAPRAPTLGGVNGNLTTLYRMIEIDAAPTAAQLAEIAKAEQELAALAKSWDALAVGPLAQLNTAFAAAGLSAIQPMPAPETRQEHGEEE
jgi:hypothetical protein